MHSHGTPCKELSTLWQLMGVNTWNQHIWGSLEVQLISAENWQRKDILCSKTVCVFSCVPLVFSNKVGKSVYQSFTDFSLVMSQHSSTHKQHFKVVFHKHSPLLHRAAKRIYDGGKGKGRREKKKAMLKWTWKVAPLGCWHYKSSTVCFSTGIWWWM